MFNYFPNLSINQFVAKSNFNLFKQQHILRVVYCAFKDLSTKIFVLTTPSTMHFLLCNVCRWYPVTPTINKVLYAIVNYTYRLYMIIGCKPLDCIAILYNFELVLFQNDKSYIYAIFKKLRSFLQVIYEEFGLVGNGHTIHQE